MALYRLIVLGIAAVASVGFAQDVSAPVEPPDQGEVMDEQRVREIVREELAKILSRQAEPIKAPRPEPEPDPEATELAPVESDAALIERARRIALAYSKNLPNFVCTQTSHVFTNKSGDGYDWRQDHEAVAEVQFVDGRESYRTVSINGRPSNKDFRRTRNSRGEFGTTLYDLFRPEAEAVFKRSGDAVIGGRDAAVFRCEVANPRYGFRLKARRNKKSHIGVGYRGLVSIDRATGNVLRIDSREMLGIPPDYPVRQASNSVDYGYVSIGGESHLLPVRSRWRWVVRQAKKPHLYRSETEWSGCRKFGAESMVEFE